MAQGNELFGIAYQKNEWVYRQGDPGDTMVIIQSGAVEVRRRHEDREETLAVLGKGEFFGEMALIDRSRRSVSVVTLCPSRLLPLTRESLLSHIQEDPAILLNLMQVIGRRIEKTNSLLRDLVAGDEELRSRLADREKPEPLVEALLSDTPTGPSVSVQAPGPPADFPGLSDGDDLQGLEEVRYGAGELIFHQGDPGETFYLILEGRVEIEQEKAQETYRLAGLGPGDFFGEMALITGEPRSASARAETACRMVIISREPFWVHLKTKPELGLAILQTLILRLRRNVSLAEVPARSPNALQNLLTPPLKKKGPIRLAVVSLSSCGGCAASLLDDPEDLSRLLEKVQVTYCPLLTDEVSLPDSEVILVEGAVRMEEDEEKLREARQKGRVLVAWGTCAALGGIPSLANHCELETLQEASFGRARDTVSYYLSGLGEPGSVRSRPDGAKMVRRVDGLDARVRVDYFLPGCPPGTGLLLELIRELSGEPLSRKPKGVVCGDCGRKVGKTAASGIVSHLQTAPDRNTCLASQGAVCLGFVTKGGCGAPCTKGGFWCWGCRGPSETAARKLNEGTTLDELAVEQFRARSRLEEGPLRDQIKQVRISAFSALGFPAATVWNPAKLR